MFLQRPVRCGGQEMTDVPSASPPRMGFTSEAPLTSWAVTLLWGLSRSGEAAQQTSRPLPTRCWLFHPQLQQLNISPDTMRGGNTALQEEELPILGTSSNKDSIYLFTDCLHKAALQTSTSIQSLLPEQPSERVAAQRKRERHSGVKQPAQGHRAIEGREGDPPRSHAALTGFPSCLGQSSDAVREDLVDAASDLPIVLDTRLVPRSLESQTLPGGRAGSHRGLASIPKSLLTSHSVDICYSGAGTQKFRQGHGGRKLFLVVQDLSTIELSHLKSAPICQMSPPKMTGKTDPTAVPKPGLRTALARQGAAWKARD
ncbi:hypothetical protein Cadr_000027197 [Camelus dromedarius]|uniref:Uncharacterized protein n=1 Tax=Camelus dromedarius TaxID=9838 RepID=A0A5N4CC28_CAMDR|nr:hypothetical protein Cadr_000027197 [Camelus dromedarius]